MLGDHTPLHISINTYEFFNQGSCANQRHTHGYSRQSLLTLQSLMLLTTWLYSLLKVCVRRRRHCNRAEMWLISSQQGTSRHVTTAQLGASHHRLHSHLCGQLLLTIDQALYVG